MQVVEATIPDGHPVGPASRACSERGPCGAPRGPATPGVGAYQPRQPAGDPHPPDPPASEAGEDGKNLTYIFAEPRVGYTMAEGSEAS